ncbi:PFE-CTERM domain-containing protein [Microseira wollei]|uniref:Ig n=1 Tax=Microseira wollei NIES-4236 TaxID=2530354 RepID=A0AAV3XHL9_9CYAN|nr:hypothetical protein [Microseira wollei]GET38982.1 putative Ig [Microseira wollei NIES-4236]
MKTALAAITVSLSLLAVVSRAQAVQVTLYDGNPNVSPGSQGQLGFGALAGNGFPLSLDPANPTSGYESVGSGGRTVDTAFTPPNIFNSTTEYAGYANYNPLTGQFFNRTYTLDQTLGYSITFNLALNSSTDNTLNRSAFSITVTSSDGLSGIEIGFEPNSIIGRNADFTPGDTANFNTSASTNYTLAVVGNNYTLSWGSGSLAGALRSYSFDPANSDPPLGTFNPYRIGNFLSFADNTGQESGTFTLGAVSVSTNTAAAVPFNFNPTFGLLILGAWTGFIHLKTQQK